MTRPPRRLRTLAIAPVAALVLSAAPHARAQAPAPPPAPEDASDVTAPDEDALGPAEAVVLLRTGRQLTGLVMEQTPEALTLRIGGLDQRLAREDIVRVTALAPVLDRYRAMRATIAPDDVDELLLLVDWLQRRERFRLALQETRNVLTIDPGNAAARAKRVLLEQQIALLDKSSERATPDRDRSATPDPAPVDRSSVPLITDDQVNLIKVYELNLADPGRLIVPRTIVDEILDKYRGQPGVPMSREGRRALYAARPAEIASLLFSLRARELYGQIQVQDHPPAFETFRDDVHRTWLQNSCASNRCHGGDGAGRLWLANRRPNAERTIYTNFLILDRFRVVTPERPDGVPLIDYDTPERSPLLQMTLPEDIALFKHPPLTGRDQRRFRPIFNSMDDPHFRKAVAWIRGLHQPRPEYPIEYDPPLPPGAIPADIRALPGER